MSEATKKIAQKAGKYKYPLIALAAGILLMLLPTGAKTETISADTGASKDEQRMEYVLSGIAGAGETRVLYTENGVVVVCDGADNAEVRLNLTNAVAAATGYKTDRIEVLKISNFSIGEAIK